MELFLTITTTFSQSIKNLEWNLAEGRQILNRI